MSTQAFRFLDLPFELCLIVYDNITTTAHRNHVPHPQLPGAEVTKEGLGYDSWIKLSLLVALLATCRTIHQEARSIMKEKLRQLEQEPIRMQVDMDHS